MSSEAAKRFIDGIREGTSLPLTDFSVGVIEELYDRHQPNLSGGECLYAFFGHLCNLPDPIVLSKKHNPVRVHDLIATFCRLNNIPDPEPGWEKRLNPKFYREIMMEDPRCPKCNQTIVLEEPTQETAKMDGNCVMHHQPLSLCPECQDNAVKKMRAERNEEIIQLRYTLIVISVEDCSCTHEPSSDQISEGKVVYLCPRCRALEVLEAMKAG